MAWRRLGDKPLSESMMMTAPLWFKICDNKTSPGSLLLAQIVFLFLEIALMALKLSTRCLFTAIIMWIRTGARLFFQWYRCYYADTIMTLAQYALQFCFLTVFTMKFPDSNVKWYGYKAFMNTYCLLHVIPSVIPIKSYSILVKQNVHIETGPVHIKS